MNDITRIRDKLPILQVSADYGLPVTRKGNRPFISCPWHNENTPSAELYPVQNKGYCHGCKKGFDSIDLWAHFNNCTNTEAVKRLAERFKPDQQQKKHVAATYDYTDAAGALLFQAVRMEPKGFYQRRPDGRGDWINDLKGVEPVPYHLPELLAAIERNQTIYIVEGCKDAENIIKLGMVATCNSGGAGKWTVLHSKYFTAGCNVVVLPDNDIPGHDHAQSVARQLHERSCHIKVVNLPDLPPKGDVSDWLNTGHTHDELLRLVESAPYWEPVQAEPVNGPKHFHYTELGSAERLLYQNAEDIRFCPELNLFLVWDGKRWKKDTDGGIKRLAMQMVRGMYDVSNVTEPEVQLKWAKTCESRAKLESIVELTKALPGVPISINELDQGKYLVNCLNGTIDLKTGKLLPHAKEHNITHLLPFEYRSYDADSDCRRWVQFLCEITDNNLEIMRYLWKVAGLCLSGDTSEHVLNIFYGAEGRNGKGVFIQVLQDILGELQCNLPFATFEPKNAGGIPCDIAAMAGKRLVIAQESNEGKRIDEATVKSLTGGDMLTGRFMRCDFFQFKPTHKIIMSTNNRPVIKETSNAIWARLRLIPFEVSFEGREDRRLIDKLQKELPEIFAWCVAGFAEWQREGLEPPECIKQVCREYRAKEDVIQIFIDECCTTNENVSAAAKDLYDTFITWAARNGEKPITRRVFYDRMESRKFKKYMSNGVTRFKSIGLLDFKRLTG
ncbi:DNA primase [Sporomusa silvacetica DSM 10669]|uniref:DNA primase n=1 Tax=Sporomusa silvacetica DSM 10669 TaxID=1123289 RepID=A0ABZ3IIP4_9FIRM|nr:phage/plasmid primase, P4 family [Sporomusa silvacetica]OZC18354.1 DNA primase [Sporomusa silvacetica DSM 10669]